MESNLNDTMNEVANQIKNDTANVELKGRGPRRFEDYFRPEDYKMLRARIDMHVGMLPSTQIRASQNKSELKEVWQDVQRRFATGEIDLKDYKQLKKLKSDRQKELKVLAAV